MAPDEGYLHVTDAEVEELSASTASVPAMRELRPGEWVDVSEEIGLRGMAISGPGIKVADFGGGSLSCVLAAPLHRMLIDIAFLELLTLERALEGREIRLMRRRAGMTQAELAVALGVGRDTLISYEKRGTNEMQTSLAIQHLMGRLMEDVVSQWSIDIQQINKERIDQVRESLWSRKQPEHSPYCIDANRGLLAKLIPA